MDSIVDEIKARIAVDDLIGESLQLKKAGTNFKAVCPFHQERTPSFMVSPEKGIWHCFGCDEGGDIFGFVMRMEGVEFPEALRILAKKAGIELKKQDPAKQGRKEKLLEINELAAKFYQKALQESKEAEVARAYIKERELKDLTVDQFGLGYAPEGWDNLLNFLVKRGFAEQDIEKAGLVIRRKNGSGYFDRFRKRLMFPLRDLHGQTIGFTARILDKDSEEAKYINSPETEVYHKGSFLFALDQAKVMIKRRDYAILVEGQMDAISSHQAEVTNVIATSGTALTKEQLDILQRYTKNLILAFDMDNAGQAAMRRGIDLAVQNGFNIRVAVELEGKDPDDIIKQGKDKWQGAIKNSVSIIEFYFRSALANADLSRVEDKKKVARELLPQLMKVQDAIEQEHYLQKLASLLKVDEEVLRGVMNRSQPAQGAPQQARTSMKPTDAPPSETSTRHSLSREERLIMLALENERYIDTLLDTLNAKDFVPGDAQDLYKELETFYNNSRHFERKAFLASLSQNNPSLARQVDIWSLALEYDKSQITPFDAGAEIEFALKKVKEDQLRKRLTQVEIDLRLAEGEKQEERIAELTQEFQRILDQLNKVTRDF